jgi:hypothetical protein
MKKILILILLITAQANAFSGKYNDINSPDQSSATCKGVLALEITFSPIYITLTLLDFSGVPSFNKYDLAVEFEKYEMTGEITGTLKSFVNLTKELPRDLNQEMTEEEILKELELKLFN